MRLIPGSAAPSLPSGSTSALRSIPVIRPPPTARLSGSPARPPQTNASASRRRRQSPRPSSRVLARRRRLAQPQRPRPRSRPPRTLRVGSSLAPASCAGGLRCSPRPTRLDHPCSSFARLTHVPMRSRANAIALRSTRHPQCQARRWRRRARRARGRRHCAGPAPACVVSTSLVGSSLRPSTSRVMGFICHGGCELRSHNPTICKACSSSGLVQAFRRPGAFTPLRSVALHIAGLCDLQPGLTAGGISQPRANKDHWRQAAASMRILAALPRQ